MLMSAISVSKLRCLCAETCVVGIDDRYICGGDYNYDRGVRVRRVRVSRAGIGIGLGW